MRGVQVCGGGHSEQPNEIVFCERCDVAVHQECYAVPSIPEGTTARCCALPMHPGQFNPRTTMRRRRSAVPTACIGVPSKPAVCAAGEWLCWPCKLYEEGQLAAGRAQAEIRKPRWEATASSPTRCRRRLASDSRRTASALGSLRCHLLSQLLAS
jgi:PHD-finger